MTTGPADKVDAAEKAPSSKSPTAASVKEAGWPTTEQLRGKRWHALRLRASKFWPPLDLLSSTGLTKAVRAAVKDSTIECSSGHSQDVSTDSTAGRHLAMTGIPSNRVQRVLKAFSKGIAVTTLAGLKGNV